MRLFPWSRSSRIVPGILDLVVGCDVPDFEKTTAAQRIARRSVAGAGVLGYT
jgi:hypothetical protein